MSFPLPNNILQLPNDTAKKIMRKVFARQNVGVSKSMEKMGYNYAINYGVTIPQLKAIASDFKADHALAIELRKFTDIREAIILSSMLDEPSKLSKPEILDICNKINNVELIEQFSRNLFSAIPDIMACLTFLLNKSLMCKSLSLMSFAWALKLGNISNDSDVDFFISEINKTENLNQKELMRPIKFAMQVISDYSEKYNVQITKMAQELSESDNSAVAQLGQDFLWLNTQ